MNYLTRIYLLLAIVPGLFHGGCSFGDDVDALKNKFEEKYGDSASGSNLDDTETATDTVMGDDSASAMDSSDTESTGATDTFIDTVTTADTATETGTSDDSDSGESIGSDTVDTTPDSASVTDSETASDTYSDSDSDSATVPPVDTETGTDCSGMEWVCGDGTNNLGYYLDCNAAPGCADTGQICDNDAHGCIECDSDDLCGPDCIDCGDATPRCKDGLECVQCLADDDCSGSTPVCDTSRNICVECVTNGHCRPTIGIITIEDTDTGVDTATETDTDTGTDTGTSTDTTTETDTGTETSAPDTDTAYIYDTNRPWQSPLGVCTPDNSCSCWVETPGVAEVDPEGTLKADCDEHSDCPDDDFRCVTDFLGYDGEGTPFFHKVCLRICHSDWGGQYYDGLECRQFGSIYAWVPVTTCYAFRQLGNDCTSDYYLCSVDGDDDNGDGDIIDATCSSGICTYPCADDTWCASGATCGTAFPFDDRCVQ